VAGHKKQTDYLRKCFEVENNRWTKILGSPQELEQLVSKRLDCDKLVFAPKLNHLQLDALRSSQTYEAVRLQELYEGIRSLEMTLTKRRKSLAARRNLRYIGRLIGCRPSKIQHVVSKVTAATERRSIRDLQTGLFRLKRQYRALLKNYAHTYGFSSYAHRNAQYPYLKHRTSLAH
jgi:hypothetical protein